LTSKTRQLFRIILIIAIIYSSAYVVLLSLRFVLGTEYPVVVVKGISMEPTIYAGDILIIKGAADVSVIELQDVIVFHSPYEWNTLIVHRVVEITSSHDQLAFKTKGDNNSLPDPWLVPEENVAGIVLQKIEHIGRVVNVIQSPFGVGTLFSLIIIIIVFELFWQRKK